MQRKRLPTFKRRRKRRPVLKDVRCTVRVIVGGRTVKTVKRRLTLAQAAREIGGDVLCNEGRLLTGIPLNKRRTIVRGVTVVLMYVADHRPRPESTTITVNMQEAIGVIRAGLPL
jgi:hypothetical protein